MNRKAEITMLIKTEAKELGFQDCGIAPAGFLDRDAVHLTTWLSNNMHAGMSYMKGHFDKRTDPAKLVPGARSVISVILNYYQPEVKNDNKIPQISKYAYGRDYHKVVKGKLKKLLEIISEFEKTVTGQFFVDSAPVLERAWAARSGLGWIGKNSNLINRKYGSFIFIGELIIDIDLEYDNPAKDYCGNCTKCIDACPINAIVADRVIDANRCISYHTIENKEEIENSLKGKMENWVFGCDICQDICPWNKGIVPANEPDFIPRDKILEMTRDDWNKLDEKRYNELFSGTAVKRAGFSGLKRNIAFLEK
ncbi:MAG: tRNA epoxyqueuosine(34) reductase QueG [Bacteroidetes bacterium]|nr:tRNA epoxyqueuosine(34) reductase QueG [Bacteroidota bacterium]